MSTSINLHTIIDGFKSSCQKINRYRVALAFVLVAATYGFVLFRIQTLNGVEPSTNQVSAQTNPTIGAHIDKHVVEQLQKLRDNSVNVQTLFNQGRDNPFQE